jgi:hypothetical protein
VRRIVIVVILVAAFAVAGYMLLRPKGGAKAAKAKTAVTDSTGGATDAFGKAVAAKKAAAKRVGGKTTGSLTPMTREERKAQVKKLRAAEKLRKKELKRQEREKRKMLKYARSRRGKRRTSRKGVYYTVKAIVSLGNERYALVDSRRVQVGDVVMGRRIVAIEPDRVEIEAFGRRSAVRVGESLLPAGYSSKQR